MPNYVRAQFCLRQIPVKEQLIQWLLFLESSSCQMIGADTENSIDRLGQVVQPLLTPLHERIQFHWHTDERTYETDIMRIWLSTEPANINISFNVADNAFFYEGIGRRLIEFAPNNPNDYKLFQAYKQLIVAMIQYLDPSVGVIDFEMDLVSFFFENKESMASWGTYLSATTLERWEPKDLDLLKQTVDETIWIDEQGLLSFIHPLAANQAWTSQHMKLQQPLDRNPIM